MWRLQNSPPARKIPHQQCTVGEGWLWVSGCLECLYWIPVNQQQPNPRTSTWKKYLEGKTQNQGSLPTKQDWWSLETLPTSGCYEPEKPPLAVSHGGWSAQAGVGGAGGAVAGVRGCLRTKEAFLELSTPEAREPTKGRGRRSPNKAAQGNTEKLFLTKTKTKKLLARYVGLSGVAWFGLVF